MARRRNSPGRGGRPREIRIRRMALDEARWKLESELNEAFMQGVACVHVIHGIGQGRLKAMALQVLSGYDFCRVRSEEDTAVYNPGVLVVDLFPPDRATLRRYR